MTIKSLFYLFLIPVLFACAAKKPVQESFDVSCSTLPLCLLEIDKRKYEKYGGISEEETALAKRITEFGEPALVELIKLLESDDPAKSQFAGYAITEFEFIDKSYFAPIKASIEKGMGWLDRALGVIDTDEAAEYAVDNYLKSESSSAVVKQGERALPFILARAECDPKCDPRKMDMLVRLVSDMTPAVKKSFAQKVVNRIKVDGVSRENKRNLLSLLFAIGENARFIEEDLQKIKNKNADLGLAINGAFIGIKSKYSGRVFADLIQSAPSIDIYMLRQVAEMGPAAIEAGPALEALLSNPQREIRLGAARAIGYLGYGNANPKIILFLNNKYDAPLNWVASEALGMIGNPNAIPALEVVSKSHWHPVIRLSAQNAIDRIKTGQGRRLSEEDKFAYDFFNFNQFDMKSCKRISLREIQNDSYVKLDRYSKEKDLKKLAYTTIIYSYGPDDEVEQRQKDPDGVITVDHYNIVEHQEVVEHIPDVALKIEDGWFAGGDRGEWGGELVHINQQGKVTKLFDDNVQNIMRIGDSYIAVTGLAHIGLNSGQILKLEFQNGQWQAVPWIYLPGAPAESWLVETGELYIATYNGGSILVSASGNPRMAQCLE
jgi:hypothetical protein